MVPRSQHLKIRPLLRRLGHPFAHLMILKSAGTRCSNLSRGRRNKIKLLSVASSHPLTSIPPFPIPLLLSFGPSSLHLLECGVTRVYSLFETTIADAEIGRSACRYKRLVPDDGGFCPP